MEKAIFVTSNSSSAVKAACVTYTGFFIAFYSVRTVPHIDGAVPSVKGLKTFTHCLGWTHGKGCTVFCCPSSHKLSNKAMRTNNNSFTLEALRERVSSVPVYLETKKILSEIFLHYFTAQLYVESNDSYRHDTTYLAVLLNDLLDELLVESLQNPINNTKPCNN